MKKAALGAALKSVQRTGTVGTGPEWDGSAKDPRDEASEAEAEQAPREKRQRGRPRGSSTGRRKPNGHQPEAQPGTNVVIRISDPPYVFEQSYKKCGKGCSVCVRGGEHYNPRRPGHGPYWYRLYRKDGRVFRKYVGVTLRGKGGMVNEPATGQ